MTRRLRNNRLSNWRDALGHLVRATVLVTVTSAINARAQVSSNSCSNWINVPGYTSGTGTTGIDVDSSTLFVFVVSGGDDGVLYNKNTSGTWSGWTAIPGRSAEGYRITPVRYQGQLNIFVRDRQGTISRNTWNGTGWNGWTYVLFDTAIATGDLAAVEYNNQLWLFYIGYNNVTYYTILSNGSWGTVTSAPGGNAGPFGPAVAKVGTTLHLFHRSGQGSVLRNIYANGSWGSATTVIGLFSTAGLAATQNDFQNGVRLYARGPQAGLFRNDWTGSAWLGWVQMSGAAGPAAPLFASPSLYADGSHYAFVTGGNDGVYYAQCWTVT